MSYDVFVFAASTKAQHMAGTALDVIDHEPIDPLVRARFGETLETYGYARVGGDDVVARFEHSEFGIGVSIRESEISFSAPFGDATFEALMTASEICGSEPGLALFDPQVGEWNE